MIIPRNEFEDLTNSICKSETEWAARFALLRCYDEMARRIYIAECERNAAQLKTENAHDHIHNQGVEIQGLHANLSYEKETNKIIGAKLQRLEKAEAVWIREASTLRTALDNTTNTAIEAEAKAEKYYRKVRELEIALRLNCKMEPPATKEIKEEFSQQPTTLLHEFSKAEEEYRENHPEERGCPVAIEHVDIIDEIQLETAVTWSQIVKLQKRAAELREIVRGFENERIRLQSLLHSAVLQADANYLPYRKMVSDARAEVDKTAQKLSEARAALHNLVEACHRADNDGELSSEIDGTLMDAAWEALK